MKKLVCTCLTLIILFATAANAQVKVGVIGGLNFANITHKELGAQSVKGDTKFGIGAIADICLFDNFELRLEPMYITKGAVATSSEVNPVDFNIKFSYLELPVLLKYSFGDMINPYLVAGPVLSYNTSSEMETTVNQVSFIGDVSDITKSLEYSVTFGGGVTLALEGISVFIEGRYTLGLNDVISEGEYVLNGGGITISEPVPDEVEMKNKGLQVLAGFIIPLGL